VQNLKASPHHGLSVFDFKNGTPFQSGEHSRVGGYARERVACLKRVTGSLENQNAATKIGTIGSR
jgi:hypothetical protein